MADKTGMFRAKWLDNGETVEGYYRKYKDKIPHDKWIPEIQMWYLESVEYKDVHLITNNEDKYEIDPTTLVYIGGEGCEWEWYEDWQGSTTDNPAECLRAGWKCSGCEIDLAEYLQETIGETFYADNTEIKPKLKFCPNCGKHLGETDWT